MTASIEMTGDSLIVHINGADKLWAIKDSLQVPLANVVRAVGASEEARSWLHGIRVGGAHIPGVLSAGRFYSQGRWCSGTCMTRTRRSGSSCATSATPGW
jgi:hypothetical protein